MTVLAPSSPVLLVLLVLASAGMLVLLARLTPVAARVAVGTLGLCLAMLAGMAAVNDFYGYYRAWSPLVADLTGTGGNFGAQTAHRTSAAGLQTGQVRLVQLKGIESGISRSALVYLPPQYYQPQYAHMRFPVVELLHGSPGSPANWVTILSVARVADRLISERLMGPMVLVMPSINDGHKYEDCVNAAGILDETYIAHDVPADIEAQFRVTTDPAQWGIAGYSSGGYCAANLGLRDRADYGAAGIIDGYYRAEEGPPAQLLGGDPNALDANSPLIEAAKLPAGTHPLPSFWISAGSGNRGDLREAQAFVTALRGLAQPSFLVEPGAGHDFYAWSAAVPPMLAWMWQQLATPDMRVEFPVAGPATSVRIPPFLDPDAHPKHSRVPYSPTPVGAPPTSTPKLSPSAPKPSTSAAKSSTKAAPRPSPTGTHHTTPPPPVVG